ncbi:MAG: hypothetical protein BGO78_10085 [Chloroflexi bacterium 44-23]|nr:MAG: hypothetical protein BGO78_10085 [Chloroflexi bacterium 44-23]
MTSDIFAEWLKRQGHLVFKTKSSYWYSQAARTFQAFPYHRVIEPDNNEINEFLKEHNGVALRYSTPLSAKYGKISYHVLFTQSTYSIEGLPKKARHDVRNGFKKAGVEPISFERLAVEGWELRLDTLIRQGRVRAETQSAWVKQCRSAQDLPGFETWGALVEGKLVAALIAFSGDDCCSILYQQSATDYLRFGINNVLTLAFTNEVLKRSDVSQIFYGLHSLDAPDSVDEYKFRMRYTASPVRQRVVFNPRLSPLFNPLTYSALNAVHKLLPGNPTFAKAEGMLRFSLQGKKPLAEQDWPLGLLEQKESILKQY